MSGGQGRLAAGLFGAVDLQLLRTAILLAVADMGGSGLVAAAVGRHCEGRGFVLPAAALAAQLAYLVDKGLLSTRAEPLSAGLVRYVLGVSGRRYLEQQGLV